MCGILGVIGPRWRDEAQSALSSLDRRGPDGRSVLSLPDCVLGHTRLAVIDLHTGDQPMQSEDGRYSLVFNGEIYNYRELRETLRAEGWRFRTESDTEVLLHALIAWGEKALPRLDGMFAFGLWDVHRRALFAARDRIGIKPFFYSQPTPGQAASLVFASTLAPFERLEGFERRLDPAALRDYLAFQTPLAPDALYRMVRQLPPACWLSYRLGDEAVRTGRYWSIPRPRLPGVAHGVAHGVDHVALVERVDQALAESVRRQLVADVPLGAFLSGGIDSSLMVRYMAQAGARPLRTFSMRFADAGFDESQHARAVAQSFGAEHHVLDAPGIDGETFRAAIHDLDQPLADAAYVMTHALSRLTRQHVTVAISGDGGDELFGGYARFWDEQSQHPPHRLGRWLGRGVDAGLLPAALRRRTLSGRELLHYRRAELGPWEGGRKDLQAYLAPGFALEVDAQRTLGRWLDLVDELGGEMDAATLMRADLWTYLSENCLVKTDRASMASSLEVRVPMLGNPVLESILDEPASVHAAGGGKAILREIARASLPRSVWDRPKQGFAVPLGSLFAGPWREVCEDAIAQCATLAPFLNAAAVQQLWRRVLAGKASRQLGYTFVVLLIWLQAHPVRV